ncbi:MAG: Xaa-Pro peptidase family protein [Planctomycetota bacterium]
MRTKKLRALLKDEDATGIIVSNSRDIRYLTGFRGEDSWMVINARKAIIISDGRFKEELEELESASKVLTVHIRSRGQSVAQAVREFIGSSKEDRYLIQADLMSVAARDSLAKEVGARRLKNATGVLHRLRIKKDASEIKAIEKAIRIQESAMEAMLDQLASGMTELEIAALLEWEMKSRGAEALGFSIIAASGKSSSLPHAIPGRTKIASGRVLTIDWGAQFDGYCGDMTRTFSFNRWTKPMGDVFDIVLEAHDAAVGGIKPGMTGEEVDAIARGIIADAGYGDYFVHSLGHGIGLNVHENPRLSAISKDVLEAGMVVTVEPGIYLPGIGGVRIENDILVTERGHRDLCRLPRDRAWSTLEL